MSGMGCRVIMRQRPGAYLQFYFVCFNLSFPLVGDLLPKAEELPLPGFVSLRCSSPWLDIVCLVRHSQDIRGIL